MTRTAAAALFLLLALNTFAAVEVPVSDAILGDAPGDRYAFDVATDGDGFLAAWIDGRAFEPTLFTARLTPAGDVLDTTGIPLMRGLAGRPQVIWNGKRYLVFWASGGDLLVSSVNRDGSSAQIAIRLLSGVTFDPYRGPAIATNGSRIVVVYGDDDGFLGSPKRLRAGVFSMDAHLLEEHVVGEADPANQYDFTRLMPSIAVRDDQFLVAWNTFPSDQQLRLNAVRLDSGGTPIDTVPHVIGSAALESTIAMHADGYVAISRFYSWGVSRDLTRITAPAELTVTSDETVLVQRGGRATVFGTVPGAGEVLAAGEFNDDGHLAGSASLSVPARGAIAAASNGSRIAVLGLDLELPAIAESSARIVFTVVDASTLQRVTGITPLTRSAMRQTGPAVAATSRDTLTVWQEDGGIRAARVLANGTRLDGRGFDLSSGGGHGVPSVVFDGERYVIAFTHRKGYLDEEVVVRFISPRDGLLPGVIRIPLAEAGTSVALANGADSVLLVWTDRAIRISRSMQLIGAPVQIPDAGESPVAAWNGREFLVASRESQWDFDYIYYRRIRGVRLNENLTLIDTESRVLAEVPGNGIVQHDDPSLAWDGTHWLLAFTSQPWGEELHPEVRVVRIDDGPIEGSVVGRGFAPELAAAGPRVWLGWKDDRPERTLRLITLDGSQNLSIQAQTPRDHQWTERFGLTLRGEQVIVAYPRISEAGIGTVPRVFLTWTDAAPPPPRRRSVR